MACSALGVFVRITAWGAVPSEGRFGSSRLADHAARFAYEAMARGGG
jgi:hypothetical protein